MKLNTTLLALVASSGCFGTASAVTALIDFGTNNTPTYNSVVASGTTALVDTTSAATGWTAVVANTGSGNMGNAGGGANVSTFPAAVSGFETTALQDSIFSNQGNGGTMPAMTLSLSGLDAGFSYDLLLYGSRLNGQGLNQRWSLTTGSGGAEVTHNSFNNGTTAIEWTVTPDAGGNIVVLLDAPTSTAGALALNFGSITENVPEPSSALLLGLSGLALVARRRR